MRTARRVLALGAAAYLAAVGLGGIVTAKALWVKKCKDMGLPAENCLYCHKEKLPKKDTFKVEELNDHGKWLMAEKDKRKIKEIDLAWLKDYPGGQEQK